MNTTSKPNDRVRTRTSRSNSHRKIDVAVAEPADSKGNFTIVDGFIAHVTPGAVIDFAIWPLVYAENHHKPATGLKPAARYPLALECQLLAFARVQQMSVSAVPRITRTEFASRAEQANEITACEEFIDRNTEVHIHFIDSEIEATREQSIKLGWFGQRLTYKYCAMTRREFLADQVLGRRPGSVGAIGESDLLLNERGVCFLALNQAMVPTRRDST
jgi:hypothetical protein